MKKKRTVTSVGNTLVKDQGAERDLPEEIEQIVEDDETARRVKLAELKDKITSGRYNIPAEDVARAIVKHVADDGFSLPKQAPDSEEEN